MRYLLDTCVLSEVNHPQGNEAVKSFIRALPSADVFISVVTIGEITKGIELLDHGKRKRDLSIWLGKIAQDNGDRVLPIGIATVTLWGEIIARAQRSGFQVGAMDGLIAATAAEHNLHIVTRNVSDFEPTGVGIVNPWAT